MRILHVIATLDAASGGPARACLEMAGAVARRGHHVDVWTTDYAAAADRPSAALLAEPSVQVSSFPVGFPRFWKPSAGMARALRQSVSRYDVLHIHSLYLFHNLAATWIARRTAVPYIVEPHGLLDPYIRRRHRLRKRLMELAFQNRALREAAAIRYTSDDEMRLATPFACGAEGVVIPLGVPLFNPQPATPRDSQCILFLSRLHAKKGLDLLIPAFARLAERFPAASLVVAGPDDGALGAARAATDRFGLSHRVSFPGMLRGEEKSRAFSRAGLFVLPSYSENFGIAVAEAMAAGVPVVVSDQVNIHHDISGAGAGIVVPCAVDPLAAAMAALLADPGARAEMGVRGRTLAETRYAWPAIALELESLYRRVSGAR